MTDLAALPGPAWRPCCRGHSDVAIGTRLSSALPGHPRAEAGVHIPHVQQVAAPDTPVPILRRPMRLQSCSRGIACLHLLDHVKDQEWFFDTELLVVAERSGLRIHEVPVDWVGDPDSRVDIMATAIADIKGIARLSRDIASGRIRSCARFPHNRGPGQVLPGSSPWASGRRRPVRRPVPDRPGRSWIRWL